MLLRRVRLTFLEAWSLMPDASRVNTNRNGTVPRPVSYTHLIIIPNLDPAKLGALIWKYKPEHMFGVPAHYQQMASSLRCV